MNAKDKVTVFQHTVALSEEWVNAVKAEIPGLDSDGAYRLLSAVLHAIRDRLPVVECAHFAAELPLLLRGTFFEGWSPGVMSRAEKRHFEEDVSAHAGALELGPSFDIHAAAHKIHALVAARISAGEMRHAVNAMPAAAREYLTGSARLKPARSA